MNSSGSNPTSLSTSIDGKTAVAHQERYGWEVELPDTDTDFDVDQASQLLNQLNQRIAAQGGGLARWRVPNFRELHTQAAATAGYSGERILVRLHRPLPLEWPAEILTTRPFVPGEDDLEWLKTNNAAFSWHPEQGNWRQAELAQPMAEPWFDPKGFLLYPPTRPGDPIAGFCWTKLDPPETGPKGEIYVIATHPDAAGRGLGKALVLAGLKHLYEAGAKEAYLYTEADNTAAMALYENLGFELELQVRVYEKHVAALAS